MSDYDEIWKSVYKTATSTAMNTAWLHWSALGANAYRSSKKGIAQVVDPEALILLSLAYSEQEPRLKEMIGWWATTGASLTSIHRLKSLLPEFGESGPEYLASFSALAAESGHRSWKRHAKSATAMAGDWHSRSSMDPNFSGAATLVIRMRAAFGTSAKSDVLSYLVSSRDSASTVAAISRAVGYTKTSIRDALTDMVRSGIANENSAWPAEYSTNKPAWKELLRIQPGHRESIPRWCLWIHIFGFLTRVKELIERSEAIGMNEHLIASKSRDIAGRYKNAFAYHGLMVPDTSRYPGKEYAEGLLMLCRSLAKWIESDMYIKTGS